MCNQPESFYARAFAWLYDPLLSKAESSFLHRKRCELLQYAHGHVLEIGAGTGLNFSCYPSQTRVLACEPSAAMLARAEKRLQIFKESIVAEITLLQLGAEEEIPPAYLPEGGFDTIVSTLVLCTVPDPVLALSKLLSYLKPGGRLLILEHIESRHWLAKPAQHFFNPLWKPMAAGCSLIRRTDLTLKELGLQAIHEHYYSAGLPMYQAVLEKQG